MRIAICDVGLGNLRSVERALVAAAAGVQGVVVEVVRDPDRVARADKVVVPGQGGFGDCARALHAGLGDVLRLQIRKGAPYLGICLGLQVLFGSSEEAAGAQGLGVLEGYVQRLGPGLDPLTGTARKVPHVGWNRVDPSVTGSLLGTGASFFYFSHSYVVVPSDPQVVAGTTEYGEPFVSAVAKDHVFACQFHPEKSQRAGLALLKAFVAL